MKCKEKIIFVNSEFMCYHTDTTEIQFNRYLYFWLRDFNHKNKAVKSNIFDG
ncbi:hypothetical protein CHRY9390_02895 [Chryseobacterium aquaeductus]|uniref:Uncharacterized protein n=1 Tax=Chryseobacterium aquaeductus TaxID=2675056 RepID=A0A9N8QTL5_9FLAO|nr:hypothetical protein CHRY9390_02895 [Chryseobacterium potabilaquae]CAD7814974.1 hypothetical protein CHRY9390_02895 [Chryseobacterium aquaeductus]